MSETSFLEQLKSHVGGLVRMCNYGGGGASGLNGKIGLLMSVSEAWRSSRPAEALEQIELLIDGSVRSLIVYPHELEFLGADDAK